MDDETAPGLSSSGFVAKLDEAAEGLLGLAERVSKHEPKANLTTARLMPFIEERRLTSNITCDGLQSSGSAHAC